MRADPAQAPHLQLQPSHHLKKETSVKYRLGPHEDHISYDNSLWKAASGRVPCASLLQKNLSLSIQHALFLNQYR